VGGLPKSNCEQDWTQSIDVHDVLRDVSTMCSVVHCVILTAKVDIYLPM
jgi:hypothetical protein